MLPRIGICSRVETPFFSSGRIRDYLSLFLGVKGPTYQEGGSDNFFGLRLRLIGQSGLRFSATIRKACRIDATMIGGRDYVCYIYKL